MLYFVIHMNSVAVFLRANVCLFGSPKLKLLAGWQVASFACLLVRRRYITAQNAWMPRDNGVRKKVLMRNFKNTLKNQCVDSNLCFCNVAVRLPENGKQGVSNSLVGCFSTSEQKGIEQCKRKEKARILQDPGPILRSRLRRPPVYKITLPQVSKPVKRHSFGFIPETEKNWPKK